MTKIWYSFKTALLFLLMVLCIFELTIFPILWGISFLFVRLNVPIIWQAKEAVNILLALIVSNIILTTIMILDWKNKTWVDQIKKEIWRSIFFDMSSFLPAGIVYFLTTFLERKKRVTSDTRAGKRLLIVFLDFLCLNESLFVYYAIIAVILSALLIIMPGSFPELFNVLRLVTYLCWSTVYISFAFLYLFNILELSHFVDREWDNERIYDYYFSSILFHPFKHPSYYKDIMRKVNLSDS